MNHELDPGRPHETPQSDDKSEPIIASRPLYQQQQQPYYSSSNGSYAPRYNNSSSTLGGSASTTFARILAAAAAAATSAPSSSSSAPLNGPPPLRYEDLVQVSPRAVRRPPIANGANDTSADDGGSSVAHHRILQHRLGVEGDSNASLMPHGEGGTDMMLPSQRTVVAAVVATQTTVEDAEAQSVRRRRSRQQLERSVSPSSAASTASPHSPTVEGGPMIPKHIASPTRGIRHAPLRGSDYHRHAVMEDTSVKTTTTERQQALGKYQDPAGGAAAADKSALVDEGHFSRLLHFAAREHVESRTAAAPIRGGIGDDAPVVVDNSSAAVDSDSPPMAASAMELEVERGIGSSAAIAAWPPTTQREKSPPGPRGVTLSPSPLATTQVFAAMQDGDVFTTVAVATSRDRQSRSPTPIAIQLLQQRRERRHSGSAAAAARSRAVVWGASSGHEIYAVGAASGGQDFGRQSLSPSPSPLPPAPTPTPRPTEAVATAAPTSAVVPQQQQQQQSPLTSHSATEAAVVPDPTAATANSGTATGSNRVMMSSSSALSDRAANSNISSHTSSGSRPGTPRSRAWVRPPPVPVAAAPAQRLSPEPAGAMVLVAEVDSTLQIAAFHETVALPDATWASATQEQQGQKGGAADANRPASPVLTGPQAEPLRPHLDSSRTSACGAASIVVPGVIEHCSASLELVSAAVNEPQPHKIEHEEKFCASPLVETSAQEIVDSRIVDRVNGDAPAPMGPASATVENPRGHHQNENGTAFFQLPSELRDALRQYVHVTEERDAEILRLRQQLDALEQARASERLDQEQRIHAVELKMAAQLAEGTEVAQAVEQAHAAALAAAQEQAATMRTGLQHRVDVLVAAMGNAKCILDDGMVSRKMRRAKGEAGGGPRSRSTEAKRSSRREVRRSKTAEDARGGVARTDASLSHQRESLTTKPDRELDFFSPRSASSTTAASPAADAISPSASATPSSPPRWFSIPRSHASPLHARAAAATSHAALGSILLEATPGHPPTVLEVTAARARVVMTHARLSIARMAFHAEALLLSWYRDSQKRILDEEHAARVALVDRSMTGAAESIAAEGLRGLEEMHAVSLLPLSAAVLLRDSRRIRLAYLNAASAQVASDFISVVHLPLAAVASASAAAVTRSSNALRRSTTALAKARAAAAAVGSAAAIASGGGGAAAANSLARVVGSAQGSPTRHHAAVPSRMPDTTTTMMRRSKGSSACLCPVHGAVQAPDSSRCASPTRSPARPHWNSSTKQQQHGGNTFHLVAAAARPASTEARSAHVLSPTRSRPSSVSSVKRSAVAAPFNPTSPRRIVSCGLRGGSPVRSPVATSSKMAVSAVDSPVRRAVVRHTTPTTGSSAVASPRSAPNTSPRRIIPIGGVAWRQGFAKTDRGGGFAPAPLRPTSVSSASRRTPTHATTSRHLSSASPPRASVAVSPVRSRDRAAGSLQARATSSASNRTTPFGTAARVSSGAAASAFSEPAAASTAASRSPLRAAVRSPPPLPSALKQADEGRKDQHAKVDATSPVPSSLSLPTISSAVCAACGRCLHFPCDNVDSTNQPHHHHRHYRITNAFGPSSGCNNPHSVPAQQRRHHCGAEGDEPACGRRVLSGWWCDACAVEAVQRLSEVAAEAAAREATLRHALLLEAGVLLTSPLTSAAD